MIEIVRYIDPEGNERLYYHYLCGNQPDQMKWSDWEEAEITHTYPEDD